MAAIFQSGKLAGGEEAFSRVNLHRESQTTKKTEGTQSPGPRAPAVISHIHLMLLSYSLSLIKQYNAFWHARDLMTVGKSISLLLPDRKALCPEQRSPLRQQSYKTLLSSATQGPWSSNEHPLALEKSNHALRQEGWRVLAVLWTCHLLLSTSPQNIFLHE